MICFGWNNLINLWILSIINLFINPVKIIGYLENHEIMIAQCRAMCLKELQKVSDSEQIQSCFDSCSKNPQSCTSYCKNYECRMGCKFKLKLTNSQHGGTCKKHNSITLNTNRCFQKCSFDSDCINVLDKCCEKNCQRYCMKPNYNYSIPHRSEKLVPRVGGKKVELIWKKEFMRYNLRNKGPLVFVLQIRHRSCKPTDDFTMSKWLTLVITEKMGAELEKFQYGRFNQFRLATVSVDGSRGYGEPTENFSMNDKGVIIDMPRNLREVLTRINKLDQVQVLIEWDPPENLNLNIDEYKITWVVDHGYIQSDGQAMVALTRLGHHVSPPTTRYMITKLKPNKSYRISVTANAYSCTEQRVVSSEAISLFIKTPKIQQNIKALNLSQPVDNLLDTKRKVKIKFDNIDFATLSVLKPSRNYTSVKLEIEKISNHFIIKWTPKICIEMRNIKYDINSQTIRTERNKIRLKKLRYNCRYEIEIKFSFSPSFRFYNYSRQRFRGIYRTKSQHKVIGQFYIPNNVITQNICDSYQSTLPIPRYLTTTSINDDSLSYKLSWLPPPKMDSVESIVKSCDQYYHNSYLFKYRIQWAPRINEPIQIKFYKDIERLEPILDYAHISQKVVEKDQHHIIVNNLNPNTLYIFRVQLIVLKRSGSELESKLVSHYLYTGSEDLLFQNENYLNTATKYHPLSSFVFLISIFCSMPFYVELI